MFSIMKDVVSRTLGLTSKSPLSDGSRCGEDAIIGGCCMLPSAAAAACCMCSDRRRSLSLAKTSSR